MKILYLVSGIGPPAGWGTEFIQEIIFEVSKSGIDTTVINPIYKHTDKKWSSWTKEQEKKYNIKIISIEVPIFIKNNLYLHFAITPIIVTWQSIKLLQKEKFDIIHEFSSSPFILIRSLIIKILFGTTTVFTLSVLNNTILGRFFWFKIFDFAKVYCIPSEEVIKSLQSSGIKSKKIKLIRPFVDVEKFAQTTRQDQAKKKLNLPTDKYIISYFGSLTAEKGIEDLLIAVDLLPSVIKSKIQVCIWAIWKGSNQHKKIVEKIKSTNTQHIKLYEKYANIPAVLSASDLLIFPQQSGHGATIPQISIIETLAANKRLIAMNILGNRDIFKDTDKVLVNPKNPRALSEKLTEIIQKDKHPTNLKIELSDFKLKKVVENYIKIYNET